MSLFDIRLARPDDQAAAYYVCLKTGDHGRDGEQLYRDDPDALGRIFVGPYFAFEPALSLVVEDEQGVCGYCLAALDSKTFYERYERDWRPGLCAQFPAPSGDPATWTRAETVHSWYHHPDYFCPEPYEAYPSHMHIDLLERARGMGIGGRMMERQMAELRGRGSPGAHVNVSLQNAPALPFYRKLGFHELVSTESSVYLGRRLG
jgi:GNAT superfamily N-acetyltransferase